MFNKYYKPSGKINFVGIIILIAAFIVAGSAVAWVYLWFNRISPSTTLCVFAAIGYGALMGFIGRLIVKKCKIASPAAALVAIIVGVVGMNYIKWGLYDYIDWKESVEYYEENGFGDELKDEMKSKTAYEWFGLDYYFNEDEYTFEENWDYVQSNAYETLLLEAAWYGEDINDYYTEDEQSEMKKSTIYEYFGLNDILGETKEKCIENVEIARKMDAYEYLTDRMGVSMEDRYGDLLTAPTLLEVLSDPVQLWEDVKEINEYGRWGISSSSSSYSYSETTDSTDNVKGVMLWIVWIGEFLIINLFAIIISYSQSKKIFINKDNNWAEVFDGGKLTFANMSKMQLKSMLEQTPDNIMNMAPVDPVSVAARPHVKLTVSHSKDFSENYLNGYNVVYNAQTRSYNAVEAFTGLVMTPKQTGALFSMFGIEPMGAIASDPEFIEWSRSGGYGQPSAPVMPDSTVPSSTAASAIDAVATVTCGSCGAQMPAGKKFCPHCGAPFESGQTSEPGFDRASFDAWRNASGRSGSADEMDSISSDDIDTTDL